MSYAEKRKRECFDIDSADNVLKSEIKAETFSTVWEVKNFSSFRDIPRITSSKFKGGQKSNHTWTIALAKTEKNKDDKKSDDSDDSDTSTDDDDGDEGNYSIFLALCNYGDGNAKTNKGRSIVAQYLFDIVDADGNYVNKLALRSHSISFCVEGKSSWGFKNFLTPSRIKNKNIVVNDTLKIYCRIWIDQDPQHTTVPKKSELASAVKEHHSLLSGHMHSILCSGFLSDARILVEKESIPVHKVILAARSPVFRAMFETEMKESSTSEVHIIDFESDVVRAMLEYIYTGETDYIDKRPEDVFRISEKYDLESLKTICEHKLASDICVENSIDVLILAHTHNGTILKRKAIQFINSRKEDVIKLESFNKIKSRQFQDLFVDLYLNE